MKYGITPLASSGFSLKRGSAAVSAVARHSAPSNTSDGTPNREPRTMNLNTNRERGTWNRNG